MDQLWVSHMVNTNWFLPEIHVHVRLSFYMVRGSVPDAACVILAPCRRAQTQTGGYTAVLFSSEMCYEAFVTEAAQGYILSAVVVKRICARVAVTCNDSVTLIVEDAGEDLIGVALQNLQADSRLNIPQTSRFVWAGSQDPPALRAKTDLPREAGD